MGRQAAMPALMYRTLVMEFIINLLFTKIIPLLYVIVSCAADWNCLQLLLERDVILIITRMMDSLSSHSAAQEVLSMHEIVSWRVKKFVAYILCGHFVHVDRIMSKTIQPPKS